MKLILIALLLFTNNMLIAKTIKENFKVESNECKHFVSVRGNSKDLPLLIILHGGPGFAMTALIQKFNKELENDFIVACYDQRGAGRSKIATYEHQFDYETFIDDCHNITNHLLTKYNKKKAFLLGHSFGSALGYEVISKYPELFHGFISVSQVVNKGKSDSLSYQFTLDYAQRHSLTKDYEVLKSLKILGNGQYETREDYDKQRKLLLKYNGVINGAKLKKKIYISLVLSSKFGLFRTITFLKRNSRSTHNFKEIYDFDISEGRVNFTVPVCVIAGALDNTTSYKMIQDFYPRIDAPSKSFVTFEKSAHMPMFKEPEKFKSTLTDFKNQVIP